MKNKEIILGIVFLIIILGINFVFAEKLGIEGIKDSYLPGDEVKLKLILYDNNLQKIQGNINYVVYNYPTDIVKQGGSNSGEEVVFKIPSGTEQKPWKIIASYGDLNVNQLFNIGELKKVEITIEGDTLVLKNVGNVPYEKSILIYIGDNDQTANVYLEVSQTKNIRLTAPTGSYDIKVIEGNEEQPLEFKGVSLTGNVIGLERVLKTGNNFWQKYPAVALFLGALLLVIIVVVIFKIKGK